MLEIIVRIMRTIACRQRLAIISRVMRVGESAPVDLARELKMARNVVSTHLRSLAGAGLLVRRRSGVWLYCTAESAYGEEALSGRILAWLKEVFGGPSASGDDSGVRELRDYVEAVCDAGLYDLVFDAATAFTDVRRLQILRRIADTGPAGLKTLRSELTMSLQAVGRHTDKLIRRGYLAKAGASCDTIFEIATKFKSPVHKTLFETIREHWSPG